MKYFALVLAAFCMVLAVPRGAWAQEATAEAEQAEEPSAAEIQVARRLFRQAAEDEAAGRWQDALQKLRDVERIKVTPGVMFHIAVCEQNLGMYVQALNDLDRADELARFKRDQGVLELIPERRREIAAKLGQLRIAVRGRPGVTYEVEVDGQKLAEAARSSAIPLNPGMHRVRLLVSDGTEQKRNVHVVAGEPVVVEFDVAAEPEAKEPVAAEEVPAEVVIDPGTVPPERGLAKKIVMYSGFALAVGGTGMGVYFLLDAKSHDNGAATDRGDIDREVQAIVDAGREPASDFTSSPCSYDMTFTTLRDPCLRLKGDVHSRDDSNRFALVSFAVAGTGAIVGTAAALWWPDDPEQGVSVNVAPSPGGLTVFGKF